MKTLGRILIVLVILIGLLVIISFFLPRKIHVERSKIIEAPMHVVFNQVNDLKNWEKWSPWHQIDTIMEINYFGAQSGEGAGYEWNSKNSDVGQGKMTITKSLLFDSVEIEMDFMEQGIASSYFVFNKTNNGINVLWGFDTDMGVNPIAKFMGIMMDKWIGTDYEKGLNTLDSICQLLPEYAISKIEMNSIQYIGIKVKCNNEEIPLKMGEAYSELTEYIKNSGIEPIDAPLCVYYYFDDKETEFEAGVPVAELPELTKKIKAQEIKAGTYITTFHYGHYMNLVKAYNALQNWLIENETEIAGAPWEKYITDPQKEPNPDKWITKIYFPIKTESEED